MRPSSEVCSVGASPEGLGCCEASARLLVGSSVRFMSGGRKIWMLVHDQSPTAWLKVFVALLGRILVGACVFEDERLAIVLGVSWQHSTGSRVGGTRLGAFRKVKDVTNEYSTRTA